MGEVVTVSAVQQARFHAHLDQAKIREWKEAYRDPTLADGERWQVKLRFADFRAESLAANVVPEHGAIDEFTRAVQDLIGDRRFPERSSLARRAGASPGAGYVRWRIPGLDGNKVISMLKKIEYGQGVRVYPGANSTLSRFPLS